MRAAGVPGREITREIRRFEPADQYHNHAVALSRDGRYALSGGGDHSLRLWDVGTGKPIRRSIRLWEVESGRKLREFQGKLEGVRRVAFSPDGRYIASNTAGAHDIQGKFIQATDKTIRLWDVGTGQEVGRFDPGKTVSSVAFTPDGRFLLSGGRERFLRLWEVPGAQEVPATFLRRS